jgi:hypothetical protein
VLVRVGAVTEAHDLAVRAEAPDVHLVLLGDALAGRLHRDLDVDERNDDSGTFDDLLKVQLVEVSAPRLSKKPLTASPPRRCCSHGTSFGPCPYSPSTSSASFDKHKLSTSPAPSASRTGLSTRRGLF